MSDPTFEGKIDVNDKNVTVLQHRYNVLNYSSTEMLIAHLKNLSIEKT